MGSPFSIINKIGPNLTCNEERSSLKDYATECYKNEWTAIGCLGFYIEWIQNSICTIYPV